MEIPKDTSLVILLLLYILPTIVASVRKHPQGNPIAIINLFLGWTLLGWVVALAWASSNFHGRRS